MKFLFLLFANLVFAQTDTIKTDSLFYKNLGANFFAEKIIVTEKNLNNSESTFDLLEELTASIIQDSKSFGLKNNVYFSDDELEFFIDGRSFGIQKIVNFNLYNFPKEWISEIEFKNDALSAFQTNLSSIGFANFVTKDFSSTLPLTKIFYEQGPYDFGVFDAQLSQNIFKNSNFSFGLTRNFFGSPRESDSFKGRFENEFYDGWIYRLKFRSEINEYFTTQFSYFGSDDKKGINGGLNFTDFPEQNFYDEITAIVNIKNLQKKVTQNHFDYTISFSDYFLKNFSNKLHFYHSNYLNVFTGFDSLSFKDSKIKINGGIFSHEYISKFANLTFQSEIINYQTNEIFLNFEKNILQNSFYGKIFPINFISSEFFIRQNNKYNNFGLKIIVFPINNFNFFGAISNLQNDIISDDVIYITAPPIFEKILINDVGFNFGDEKFYLKFSKNKISKKNDQIDEFNIFTDRNFFESGITFNGLNLKFMFYKFNHQNIGWIKEFGKGKISYLTPLFNSKLKSEFILNSKYYLLNNSKFFNFDFLISTNIDDVTVNFKFENISDAKQMIIVGYPILPRGIKFSIAWNFVN